MDVCHLDPVFYHNLPPGAFALRTPAQWPAEGTWAWKINISFNLRIELNNNNQLFLIWFIFLAIWVNFITGQLISLIVLCLVYVEHFDGCWSWWVLEIKWSIKPLLMKYLLIRTNISSQEYIYAFLCVYCEFWTHCRMYNAMYNAADWTEPTMLCWK